jgi:hypothetical protein
MRMVEITMAGQIKTVLSLETVPGPIEIPEGAWFYGPLQFPTLPKAEGR